MRWIPTGPREDGIKFNRTVICLCPVKACLHVPGGWDDRWRLAGTPRGLSQTPHTAELVLCEIRMRNVSEPRRLSGYWSKKRLGEAVLPHLPFITLHVKDNQSVKPMSESVKQERWRYATAEVGFPPPPQVKRMLEISQACRICTSQRAILYCIIHFPIPNAPH